MQDRKLSPETGQAGEPDGETGRIEPHAENRVLAERVAAQLRQESYSPQIIVGLLRLFEFVGLLAGGLAIFWLYVVPREPDASGYVLTMVMVAVLTSILLQAGDAYQIPALRTPMRSLRRVGGAWLTAMGVLLLSVFFLKIGEEYSRVWLGGWLVYGFAFLFVSRQTMAWTIRRWIRDGTMERRAVIVGGGETAKDLIRRIESDPYNDVRICGIFDDRDARRSPDIVAGYPKLGNTTDLLEFARQARIDMLVISLPITAEKRVLELLKQLWVLPLDIRLAAHANKLRFRPRSYSYLGAVPMLDVLDRPIRDWDSVAKRIFDIGFTLVALALLWPVMIGTAIAVKATSKGPIFFKQKRHGFNNQIIEIYKFRSMFTEMSDHAASKLVTKDDPRVTPVGRFIRKTSIDELPQLFNVLKGDISLVGPRPHAMAALAQDRLYAEVVEGYFARHRVKPGVTGWAQINGWRGETDSYEKIRQRTAYDLYYIENWSIFLDLKILFLTPLRLLGSENAY